MDVSTRTLLTLQAPNIFLMEDVFVRVLGDKFDDPHYTLSEADIVAIEGEFYRLISIHARKRLHHFTATGDVLAYAQSDPDLSNFESLMLRRAEREELTSAMDFLREFVSMMGHTPSEMLNDYVCMGGSMEMVIDRIGNSILLIPMQSVLGTSMRDANYRLTQADVEELGRHILTMQLHQLDQQPGDMLAILDALGIERESDEEFLANWPAFCKTSQDSMDMLVDDFLYIVRALGLKLPAEW